MTNNKETKRNLFKRFHLKEKFSNYFESFSSSFTLEEVIVYFMGFLFSTVLSTIIFDPLFNLTHYIRTQELIEDFDYLTFIVYVFLIVGILIALYYISKRVKNWIDKTLEYYRQNFLLLVFSIIFATLISSLIINPIYALSYLIVHQENIFDLGLFVDYVLAFLLLLLIYLAIYGLLQWTIKKKV